MSKSTEIRHIEYNNLCKLSVRVLESWKNLMAIIPKDINDLQNETYVKKYTAEHIK